MCGIVGIWSFDVTEEQLKSTIASMGASLSHRGPDGSGFWLDSAKGVGLGHRRLSILDLTEAGSQPMFSPSRSWVVVLNGEIYNHLILRELLLKSGFSVVWRGHSDTETLAACIEFLGIEKTLGELSGMFAFAAWHVTAGSLFLARDRFGEKPLYFAWSEKAFVFGSELKAIRASRVLNLQINTHALAEYFRLGCIPAPLSIYENCEKLTPGYYLEINLKNYKDRKFLPKAYWSLAQTIVDRRYGPQTDAELCNELEQHLGRAVSSQLISDVPLGAFLSGGLDSSTIVALMQAISAKRVKTFTVGFDEMGFDEAPYARAVAHHLGTDHHELRVTAADALAVVPNLPLIYDEPFADSSQIPTYWVCRAAKNQVTVALSGDGGDELFGGYNRHVWGDKIWSKVSWMPFLFRRFLSLGLRNSPRQKLNDFGDFLAQHSASFGVAHLGDKIHKMGLRLDQVQSVEQLYASLVSDWDDLSLLVKNYSNQPLYQRSALQAAPANLKSSAERMMFWDSVSYLPNDILCKVDRAAMSVSLETRAPFLDHKLAEFVWGLPLNQKIRNGQGKWILRQVLYKYVPKHLIERPKAGFGIPLGAWLRGPLREWAEGLLNERDIESQGYLHAAPVTRTWREHLRGKVDYSQRLWSVLMFQAWLKAQTK